MSTGPRQETVDIVIVDIVFFDIVFFDIVISRQQKKYFLWSHVASWLKLV